MRDELLDNITNEITQKLGSHLRDEGITLYMAANDNCTSENVAVILEAIEAIPLSSTKLITEISVILGVLGKSWQHAEVIEGIYQCLHPHHLTIPELTVLLMSMHVESVRRVRYKRSYKKAIMRYIVEQEDA